MIDFKEGFMKLGAIKPKNVHKAVPDLLVDGEEIIGVFATIRDQVVFTNKRVIAINVQGVTGLKADFTSLPYSKIQAFSFETAGLMDIESELELFMTPLGLIRFEFIGWFDIKTFSKCIAQYIL